MRYTTEIVAICPISGHLVRWCGPYIEAESFEDADNYCQENGLGYCKVTGLLVEEIEAGKEIIFYNRKLN